jgi:hypothetical protein
MSFRVQLVLAAFHHRYNLQSSSGFPHLVAEVLLTERPLEILQRRHDRVIEKQKTRIVVISFGMRKVIKKRS